LPSPRATTPTSSSAGAVAVTLTTHAAGGLTDNDFILAAKLDRL
jgi:pterin-4a-carbinolamine dehydratase